MDGQTLEYDATGNLTQDRASDGALTNYTYDMENHLVAVDGENDGTLRYDVLGRLAKLVTTVDGTSTTTLFHYDGDALVGEYRSGAVYRRYVHGDQVDEPLIEYQGANLATRRYLHADHQGSIIAHSTTLGAVTQTNAYDPYGIPRPDDQNVPGNQGNEGRFGYTGQAWIPELGLNYYKARVYSPKLGRFLQTDPIFYKDDMNLYAYVGNDPVNRLDPSGTKGCGGTLNTLEGTCTHDTEEARADDARVRAAAASEAGIGNLASDVNAAANGVQNGSLLASGTAAAAIDSGKLGSNAASAATGVMVGTEGLAGKAGAAGHIAAGAQAIATGDPKEAAKVIGQAAVQEAFTRGGMVVGSWVNPGVGTAVGGVVGNIIGGSETASGIVSGTIDMAVAAPGAAAQQARSFGGEMYRMMQAPCGASRCR